MKNLEILSIIITIIGIVLCSIYAYGFINMVSEPIQSHSVELIEPIATPTQVNTIKPISTELYRFKQFLYEDKTNELKYNGKIGIDYFVCTGFTRTLAENASKYNISLGGASVRDTPSVGVASKSLHAVNYGIFDDKFYFVDPQTDTMYTINCYKNITIYKYASLHKDANEINNYIIARKTIDLDFNDYNESQIIDEWK